VTRYVAVIGPGDGATREELDDAREVGRLLGAASAIVLTGGLGRVMEAAAAGARATGGVTIGLLPGNERSAGNAHLTVAIATGMGEMRNLLLVRSADAVIAVGGSWGTMSEVALAMRTGKPVAVLRGWELHDSHATRVSAEMAGSPLDAVSTVLERLS